MAGADLYEAKKMPPNFGLFKRLRKEPKWFKVLCDNFVPGVVGKKWWDERKVLHHVSKKVTVSDIGLVLTILQNKWEHWKAKAEVIRKQTERDEQAKKLLKEREKQLLVEGQEGSKENTGETTETTSKAGNGEKENGNNGSDEEIDDSDVSDESDIEDLICGDPKQRAKDRKKHLKMLLQRAVLPTPMWTSGKQVGRQVHGYDEKGLDAFSNNCMREARNRAKYGEKVEKALMTEWQQEAANAAKKKKKKPKPRPKRRVYNELRAKLPKNAPQDGDSSDDDQGSNPRDARSKKKHRVSEETVTVDGECVQAVGPMDALPMKDLPSGPTTSVEDATSIAQV